MKRVILSLVIMGIFIFPSHAQKDLYTALFEIGKEAVYIQYLSFVPTGDGGSRIENTGARITLEPTFNPYNKIWGMEAYDAYPDQPKKRDANRCFGYNEYNDTDHYVYPAYIRNSFTKKGWLMADSILFKLDYISEDGSDFKIASIYLPQIEVAGSKSTSKQKEGKKLTMKQKIEAAKVKVASKLGSPMWNKASKLEMEATVKNYIKQMKVKQKTYTYTPQDLKEIQGQKDFLKKGNEAIKAYNDSIKATPEYKKMIAHRKYMEGHVNVKVTNNTNSTIWVGTSEKAFITREISSGGYTTVPDCNDDLYYYYSEENGTLGTKFYSANSACGGSVSIP